MNKLFAFLLFLLLFSLRLPAQSPSDDTGSYPAEIPGAGGNEIPPQTSEPTPKKPKYDPHVSKDLHISSQTQNETRPNYYVMEGYVDLIYKGMRLQADHAEYDAATKDLLASGNVVLDQENQHLTGDRLELNLDTKKGVMYNARGFVPPQIFFWGPKLEKLDEDTYKLHDGVFTECSQIVPHWRLKTTTTKMTVDEYIHFNNFLLKAKNIPIFYSPYMMWPIKRDRATGFLFPGFGPNSQKGFWVQPSFFWAMSRSMDSTFWLDHYALRGWGGGGEYRYASGQESNGFFKGEVMDDALLGTQWTADGVVKQDLPYFRIAGVVDYFSSYQYVRDYARSLKGALRQTRTAQLFVTRNWSYYSLNLLTDWQERQIGSSNRGSSYYHIPEIEFQSRSQKLGPTPFFVSLLSSADFLGATNRFGIGSRIDYQRYDFLPVISFPITYLSWVTLTPTFAERVTYYTKQREQNDPIDEPLTRAYQDVTLDLRGPNFSKIFDTPDSSYSKKWKHAIEPQVVFRYIENIPEKDRILVIDEVDEVFGVKEVTYSITNLLYSKRPVTEETEYEPYEYQYYNPKPLEPPVESAWELISWRIQQSYRFESDSFTAEGEFAGLKPYSPISSVVRVNPKPNYSVEFTTDYDIDFNQITRMSLRSSLRSMNSWYNNISYSYSNPTPGILLPGVPRSLTRAGNSIQVNGGVGLWKNRLVLNGDAGYNITDKLLLNGTVGVTYNDDCFSVGVQFRHFSEAFRFGGNENQFTFSISLPNIGNLVNFQSGAPPNRF